MYKGKLIGFFKITEYFQKWNGEKRAQIILNR